jgi:hypothetical protein
MSKNALSGIGSRALLLALAQELQSLDLDERVHR